MIIASLLSNISVSFLLPTLEPPSEMDDVDSQQDEGGDGDEAELMQGTDTDDDNQEPQTNIQSI